MKQPSGLEKLLRGILKYYPALVKTLQQISSILYSFINTIVSGFGSLIVLILVTIVEHHRIAEGVRSFEVNEYYVSLASAAVIASLFFIEARISVIDWIAKKNGTYIAPEKTLFSLKILGDNFRYFIGKDKQYETTNEDGEKVKIIEKWQARQQTPSNDLRKISNMIIGAVMFLVIFGSLKLQIAELPVETVWYQGLVQLVISSSTPVFMTVAAATALTLVTVIVAAKTTNISVYYAMEAMDELNIERERINKEDTVSEQEDILLVKDITTNFGRALASIKEIPCIDPNNDKINIKTNNFFDSRTGKWLSETGYETPSYLKVRITKLCEERSKS